MEFKIGKFELSIGLSVPSIGELKSTSQSEPKGFYVYGHADADGKLFYIGKGKGRRAWSTDRHHLWERYTRKHLGGVYTVRILADGMTEETADQLESDLITQHGAELVNWINFGRKMDFEALKKFHELRNANRKLFADTKPLETTNSEQAIANYRLALSKIEEYAFIEYETGLVGQLSREIRDESGTQGDIHILDRLTLCLCKSGCVVKAKEVTDEYFQKYRSDLHTSAAEKILKRVDRAGRRKS